MLSMSIFLTAESKACQDKKDAVAAAKKRIAAAEEAITLAKASRNTNMIGIVVHHVKSARVGGVTGRGFFNEKYQTTYITGF